MKLSDLLHERVIFHRAYFQDDEGCLINQSAVNLNKS
jgi:hypothetical protein